MPSPMPAAIDRKLRPGETVNKHFDGLIIIRLGWVGVITVQSRKSARDSFADSMSKPFQLRQQWPCVINAKIYGFDM